jgi:GNAT superfamily N-acetyltransferase
MDLSICGEGPPGYDSISWQHERMNDSIYYKIIENEKIIGGFYLLNQGYGIYDLIRLFVESSHQNKGIGTKAINFIENISPDISILKIEVSHFRKDNQEYYERRGFIKVGIKKYTEDAYSVIYEKKI